MPIWAASLIGDSIDLQELARLFNSPKVRVLRRGDQFEMESEDFSDLTEAVDVRAKAISLLTAVNGAATIHISSFRPVRIGAIHQLFEDGRRSAHVFAQSIGTIRILGSASATVGGATTAAPVTPIGAVLVSLAAQDSVAQEVLELLSRGAPDWSTLYKLLECVGRSTSKKKFASWISSSDLRRIRYAANSAAVIGSAARHTKGYLKPPTQPMTLDEARIKVLYVVRNWLDARAMQPHTALQQTPQTR